MGQPEKREAPPSKEVPKKSPEDAAKEARDSYQKKWDDFRKKIDEYKKSPNWALKALAARYEQRLKKEATDPQKLAPTLDEAAIRQNLDKVRDILDQFEKEPAVRFDNAVKFHRGFLEETVQKFPNEPFFKQTLAEFEQSVKKFGVPTTNQAVDNALQQLSGYYLLDGEFTQTYNREYAKNSLNEYLGNRIKSVVDKVTDFDSVTSIQVRLERGLNHSPGELKRILDDKAAGVVPDELNFIRKGLFIRVTPDGKVALIGASERAKRANHYLAELPTLPARGEPVERATEDEKKMAQAKYETGTGLYRQELYATALKRFQESYVIVASPNTRYMIAKCYEQMGLYARALEESQGLVADAEKAGATDPRYKDTAQMAQTLIGNLSKMAASEQPPAKQKGRTKKPPERKA